MLIFAGLPELNTKERWNGSDGKEYNFLKSYHESGNMKQRNEKKQNWINDIDTCISPPNSHNCDLEEEELVKSVQRWLKYFFNSSILNQFVYLKTLFYFSLKYEEVKQTSFFIMISFYLYFKYKKTIMWHLSNGIYLTITTDYLSKLIKNM